MTTRLSPTPLVDPTATVNASRLGVYTEVAARTKLHEVVLDDYSYIMNDSEAAYTVFGKFCSIAPMTRIHPVNHPMTRATQSHLTYRSSWYFEDASDDDTLFAWRRAQTVTIGHDVWIGHGAIVLSGRTIGTGAVVGAGSVVTKDVAPYTIVAGNPARVIRPRFPDRVAERLRALAWWDWSHQRLAVALPDIRRLSVEAFLDKYECVASEVA
jgi:phosphonate metabolism protein (transferase hexapeptide repeat family)